MKKELKERRRSHLFKPTKHTTADDLISVAPIVQPNYFKPPSPPQKIISEENKNNLPRRPRRKVSKVYNSNIEDSSVKVDTVISETGNNLESTHVLSIPER